MVKRARGLGECVKRLRFLQRNRESHVKGHGTEMVKQAAVILFALGMVGQVSAQTTDFLARFEGANGDSHPSGGAADEGNLDNTDRNHAGSISRE